jgi:hypothetical protein
LKCRQNITHNIRNNSRHAYTYETWGSLGVVPRNVGVSRGRTPRPHVSYIPSKVDVYKKTHPHVHTIYTHIDTHTHTHTRVAMKINVYNNINIFTHNIHTHTHTHTHTRVAMKVSVFNNIHTYIHIIYTNIHTHTHTYQGGNDGQCI